MAEETLEQVCNLFYEVAQLPLAICQADGACLYSTPPGEMPDVPAEMQRALINRYTSLAADSPGPLVEILDPTFFVAVIQLSHERYLIVGPAAPIRHDDGSILHLSVIQNVPEERRRAYCERIKQIPPIPFRNFLTTISLLNFTFNQTLVPPDAVLLKRPINLRATDESLTQALFDARENQALHTPASYEDYILQAVSEGNVTKLKQALLSPVSGAIGKMSGDPVRQEKYTFISFVTMVTRAAIRGGLNRELAFSLSDIYCQAVDKSQDILEIARLSMDMSLDFTAKVAAAQGRARLSPAVFACCEYISAHLHDEISLQNLADLVRMGGRTLSQKFKSETGLPIPDYIHRERVREAQALLEYSDYTISEIGYFLKYSSQSYFSSVFKKFSGLTPQQYREQIKKNRLY